MFKKYIEVSKEIVEKYNLQKYVDILLNYWEKNPPTLGHGFNHVIKTAVESFDIAQLNNYHSPQELFIGGLFHDIFRPAETGEGTEDQTKGAEIAKNLFIENSIDENITQKVIGAILSHDDWRGTENPPEFDVLLSYGDKISHDMSVTYGYIWSVNKFTKSKLGKPKFTNHLFPLYAFLKYEQRAWEIFIKHPIKGSDKAIDSYIYINQTTMNNYKNDKSAENFSNYVEEIAEEYRINEKSYLAAFNRSSKSIENLMKNCY